MLWTIFIFLILLLAFFTFYCIKFAKIILNLQEKLQISLDIIEEKHLIISNILKRPLFYNSQEIRQVLREIEDVKNSLHLIAWELSEDFNTLENNNVER
jgi:hypothetical protein